MERPTNEIETPVGKHKVVLREWLTGGEKRQMANEVSMGKKQELMVKSLVVSVDGEQNVVEKTDAMHGKDFDFVLLALTKIVEDSSLSEEKKSS